MHIVASINTSALSGHQCDGKISHAVIGAPCVLHPTNYAAKITGTLRAGAGFIEPLERRAYLAATPVTLGGIVWKDDNANGIRQPGELAYSGVNLRLCTSSGTSLALATTSSDGHYQFTNVTPGQSVYVEIISNLDPGSLYMLSPKDAGTDTQRNSKFNRDTCRTDVFTVVDGQNRLDLDAGAVPTSGIGGAVYEDLNSNAIEDQGEPYAPGFTTFLDSTPTVCSTRASRPASGMWVSRGCRRGSTSCALCRVRAGRLRHHKWCK